jgi:hypothetical protein
VVWPQPEHRRIPLVRGSYRRLGSSA